MKTLAAIVLVMGASLAWGQEGRATGPAGSTQAPPPGSAALTVGRPAPALEVTDWVAGEPVKSFEKGRVYAVVFWASWCDACASSIPVLNRVERKFGAEKFSVIAVSAADPQGESLARVNSYVQRMVPQITYRVAFDGPRRAIRAWMDAAEQNYIPTVFLVDREGAVVWIGSPLWPSGEFEDAVALACAGTLTPAARDALHAAWAQRAERLVTLERDATLFERQGRVDDASRALDEIVEAAGTRAWAFALRKLEMLLVPGREQRAYEFARKMSEGILRDDAEWLNSGAWAIVSAEGLEAPDLDLALRMSSRANELQQGRDAATLDTLARVYYKRGDLDSAVRLQARAVELARHDVDHPDYIERLDQYQRELEAKGK